MDRDVVEQKLESLRRCVHRIQSRCPADANVLARDAGLLHTVSLKLTRAVQFCVDTGAHLISGLDAHAPGTMGETFDTLATAGILYAPLTQRLRKAVGFRNIAVHNYEAINWHVVHAIATDHLADFTDFARAVVRRLE